MIEKVFYHRYYNQQTNENDIALLYLKNDLTQLDAHAKPVAIATLADIQRGALQPGVKATAIGWGLTCENCMDYVSYLRKVDLPIVANEMANLPTSYNGEIKPGMLVAGLEKGGKDSCQGDSGGPLVIFDAQQNKYIQIGVTSWGEGCARAKKYGVYTNVAVYADWVNAVMKLIP